MMRNRAVVIVVSGILLVPVFRTAVRCALILLAVSISMNHARTHPCDHAEKKEKPGWKRHVGFILRQNRIVNGIFRRPDPELADFRA